MPPAPATSPIATAVSLRNVSGRRQPPFSPAVFFWITLLVQCLSFVATPELTRDERNIRLPTIEHMEQTGGLLIYLYGNGYLAPVHEILSFWLAEWFGLNIFSIRFPSCLFSALSSYTLAHLLPLAAPRRLFVPIMLLWIFPSVEVLEFLSTNNSDALVAIFFLAYLAVLPGHVSIGRWGALSFTAALGSYIHPIVQVQALVIAVWLLLRHPPVRTWVKGLLRRRRFDFVILAALASAVILVLPAAYYYLTRKNTFEPPVWFYAVAPASLLCCAAALILFSRAFQIPWRRATTALLIAAAFFAAFTYAPEKIHQRIERPWYASQGITLHTGSDYHWKHWREWIEQPRILFGQALPAILLGQPVEKPTKQTTATALLMASVLAVCSLAALRPSPKRSLFRLALGGKRILLPVSFFVFVMILLPSWRLFGAASFRYLVPFLPGLYILLLAGSEQLAGKPGKWSVFVIILALNIWSVASAVT